MATDVQKGMARGIAWMSTARFAVRCLGMASTAILARILGPSDFGLLAMATAVISLAELVRAFSFDSALMQNQERDEVEFDTAWTLNVLLGLGGGLLIALAAPMAAAFYRDARVTGILLVLALAFAVGGFLNVGTVEFRKQLDFRRDFQLMVSQKVVGFVATLVLAFSLRNYWALALGSLVSACAGVVLSYLMHSYRPSFSLAARRSLIGFSQWMLISNVIMYLRNKTPDILLGRLSGPQAAGIFSMGYEVANLATTDLVAPINRAVLPGYVILGKDAHALRVGYSQVLGFIALLGVPAAIGVAALSKQVVGIVLGDKWSATADLIGILALASGMHVMLTNSAPVYLAVGKPKLIALLSMIHVVTLLPLLVGGILKFGAMGAAWAYLVHTAVVALPSTFYLLIRNSAITARDIGGSVWRPVLSAAIMYFLVRRIADALGGGTAGNQFLTLVVAVLAGAALYGALIVLLWRISGAPAGPERTLLNTIRTALRRRMQPIA